MKDRWISYIKSHFFKFNFHFIHCKKPFFKVGILVGHMVFWTSRSLSLGNPLSLVLCQMAAPSHGHKVAQTWLCLGPELPSNSDHPRKGACDESIAKSSSSSGQLQWHWKREHLGWMRLKSFTSPGLRRQWSSQGSDSETGRCEKSLERALESPS